MYEGDKANEEGCLSWLINLQPKQQLIPDLSMAHKRLARQVGGGGLFCSKNNVAVVTRTIRAPYFKKPSYFDEKIPHFVALAAKNLQQLETIPRGRTTIRE